MKLVIDLDQHEAIQDFTVKAPAGVYDFKSQDTIDWLVYFVRAGVVQDLGAGLAFKYGMIKTGDASNTLLAYQTAVSHLTDPDGNIYYLCQVNYNTSQMASAISGQTQLPCTSEVRYQTSDNEIIHSLNISCLVYPTILLETGVTPPGVSTGYPDASAIELLVHKNAASGYAGLDSGSLIYGAQIPVDNQTVSISAGKLASSSILASTSADFVTPAGGGNVSVTFGSTTNLKAGSYVRIPIAGYYIVESITNATTAVLQNNGDPFNAASGVTITSGAVVLPAQAAAGGGATGAGAYTTLTSGFTMPAVGSTVSIIVASTAWMGTAGYNIFISGAGYFSVGSVTDATHVVVTNSGGPNNQPPATSIPSGGTVTGAGVSGPQGIAVAGVNAYDTVGFAFLMPAVNATVTVTIGNTGWMGLNQIIYVATGGYFSVSNIINPTQVSLTNLGYPGNATVGASVTAGAKVSPGGLQGIAGTGGTGRDSFTTLSANFTQPTVAGTVSINVASTAWMSTGQAIYIQGGGYYQISSVTDINHAVVSNLGYTGNVAPGATVTGSGTQGVGPAGLAGQGGNSFTTTGASYIQPAVGSNVTVTFVATNWMVQNQYVFINGGGTYQVVNINDATHAILQNVAATGNVVSGSTVPTNSGVSPSGPVGPQGSQGIQGPSGAVGEAPTDGQTYGRKNSGWVAVTSGGGGGADPSAGVSFSDDFFYPGGTPGSWYSNSPGTGASGSTTSTYGQDSTKKVLGSYELATGTNASNTGIGLMWGGNAVSYNPIVYGISGAALVFKTRVFLEAALPATGGGYALRIGFGQQVGTMYFNAPNNGFYFEYSPDQNSGQWRVAVGAGSMTYTNTSVAAAADTAYDLEIDSDAGWTTLTFKINGTVAATVTTGLPTSSKGTPFWQFAKGSGGTVNQLAAIDSWMISYPVAR